MTMRFLLLLGLIAAAGAWSLRSTRRYRRELGLELEPLRRFAEHSGWDFAQLSDPGVYELQARLSDGTGVSVCGYRQRDRGARLKGIVRFTEISCPSHWCSGSRLKAAPRALLLCVPRAAVDRIGARSPADWVGRTLLVGPLLGRHAAALVRRLSSPLHRLPGDTQQGYALWADAASAGAIEAESAAGAVDAAAGGSSVSLAAAIMEACRQLELTAGDPAAALVSAGDAPGTAEGVLLRVQGFLSAAETIEEVLAIVSRNFPLREQP